MDSDMKRQSSDNQASTPSVPSGTWPGGFGLYKYSKAAINFNLWTVVGLILLQIAVGVIISSLFTPENPQRPEPEPVSNLLSWLVGSVFGIATIATVFAGIARQKFSVGNAFGAVSFGLFGKYLLLSLLQGVIIAGSLLLLIVPFFFIAPRLALAMYFMVDKNTGPLEALSLSWNATKGHVGKVYGIAGVFLLFALLCVTIIGIPFAIYFLVMYSAAIALLYRYVLAHSSDSAAEASKTPTA